MLVVTSVTYADMEVAPGFTPKSAFNPDVDYANPEKSEAPKDGDWRERAVCSRSNDTVLYCKV